ncbi:MAG: hypothetical protein K6T75_08220 [Acetobacteraceae bacterium]|nr:hypothetical protein [Acetobacteraceae bacterium]
MDWAVLGSGFRSQLKNIFARPTFQFVLLFQPLIFAVVSYMIFRNSGKACCPMYWPAAGS